MGLTTSLIGGLTVSLTTSLTEGSEEDEGTKCVEWGADTEMLSTKPIPDLLGETFEHSVVDQV